MRISSRSKLSIAFTLFALATVIVGLVATAALRGSAVKAASSHMHINCAAGANTCTEVWDSEAVFGEGTYIGHDEPSNLFYSNVPGSGNRMRYTLILPRTPRQLIRCSAANPSTSSSIRPSGSAWRCATRSLIPNCSKTARPTAIRTSSIPHSAPRRGDSLYGDAVLSSWMDIVACWR